MMSAAAAAGLLICACLAAASRPQTFVGLEREGHEVDAVGEEGLIESSSRKRKAELSLAAASTSTLAAHPTPSRRPALPTRCAAARASTRRTPRPGWTAARHSA
ncbi:unnamed protein product [Prorocentrum cordatum]|uniref:Uncharacterized protein n=1 Tax=Prorocentrum cordatum TaxID=2364126 RepID=A0ABN9QML4_9DINO|nr:unnamed protein product [Polarella glacialis]